MLRKIMALAGVVGVLLALATVCSAVQVDGYCFLGGQTNHAGIKVKFHANSPSAITDSTYTNTVGYFLIELSPGWYDVYYSYIGYLTEQNLNQNFFSSATLPNTTIYIPLSGPLSGTLAVPHIVIGDISISNGDSLVIQPGADLIFNGNYVFDIYGYLSAIGIEADSIRFIPEGVNSWGGFNFYNSASDSSRLDYALIAGSNSTGIYCGFASPTISHCTITSNSGGYAGGIHLDNSNLIISRCIITDNSASYGGGIGIGTGSSPIISQCTISGNSAELHGGGIYTWWDTSPVITNTIVEGNTGDCGIYFYPSNAYVGYCDFQNNQGGPFAGNPPPYIGQIVTINANGDSCDAYFNIFQDPQFVDTAYGDFHLQATSPCIDAGDPTSPFDPDNTIADIGAFYYDQSQAPQIVVSADSLNFGEALIEVFTFLPLTIRNQGTGNLIISGMLTAAPFSTNFNPQDSLITPGDSLEVMARFRPTQIAPYRGTLTIQNNDEPVIVQLSGEGIGPVSLTLTPTNPPITIPSDGGSFSFNINLTNLTTTTQTTDFWTEIILPGVGSLQILQVMDIPLPGSISIDRMRNQQVPASAPQGAYQYFGYVGDYPWTVQDYDSFEFRKISTEIDGGSLGSPSDWLCSGESFEITANALPPSSFLLHPCSPNPFNPTTVASYQLQVASHVSLKVYDTAGRLVATLVDGWREAGSHEVTFDGSGLPSGVYLARLQAGDYTGVQKLVLLK